MRVHEVRATADAVRVARAVEGARAPAPARPRTPTPRPPGDRPHTDVEQVELANTAFYETLERGDFDELSSLWHTPADLGVDEEYHDPADSGVISCVHPGWPVLTGRGEVLRSYALIMANTEYIQFFLTDVHVSVTGDTALVTCTENILSGGPSPTTATNWARWWASWWSPRTCSGAHPMAGNCGRTTRPR